MKKLQITKGVHRVDKYNILSAQFINVKVGDSKVCDLYGPNKEGYAQLIADAGNTYQKTGMLPSEMDNKNQELKQHISKRAGQQIEAIKENDELKQQNEVLKEALEYAKEYIELSYQHNEPVDDSTLPVINKALSGEVSRKEETNG